MYYKASVSAYHIRLFCPICGSARFSISNMLRKFIKARIVSAEREARRKEMTSRPIFSVRSTLTDDPGIARTSRAIFASDGSGWHYP